MRTKTTSRNFWLFARSERPYFSLWVYCTDSFWSEQEPSWSRMRQSVSSITSGEEFATGAAILEGHRVFAFPGYADLATTVVYLAATDKLLFERGTEAGSIRKHKLFLSNTLEQLQKLNKMIVLEGEKSQVYLVCQTLYKSPSWRTRIWTHHICRRTLNWTAGGHSELSVFTSRPNRIQPTRDIGFGWQRYKFFDFEFSTIQVTQCAGLFGFIRYFLGRDNSVYHSGSHKPQSRTIMKSRESLPPTVILFGGQSGRLKAIQAPQATMESNVRHHHLDLRP